MQLLLLLLFFRSATSLTEEDVDYFLDVFDYYDELPVGRKFDAESNEPPETNSQIANLFNNNLIDVLSTNQDEPLAVIAKYTNRDIQIRTCQTDKLLNFSSLKQWLKYLYLYFKQIKPTGFSFTTSSTTHAVFTSKFKGVTQDKKEMEMEWQGEALFDITLGHYVFSKITMLSDCSQIPKEFPKEPQESIHQFMDKLRNALENDVFKTGKPHLMANYQSFASEFLLSKARVKMCESKSPVDRTTFGEHLFKRYGQSNPVFSGLEFRTEKFSDYQTDAIFTVVVKYDNGEHTQEQYKFRISSLAEELHGWLFWLANFVEVGCPVDLRKQPDPSDTKGKFVGDVCGAISPMINDPRGVASRWDFLQYMLQRKDGGFFAIIKGYDNGRLSSFDSFTKWLEMWSSGYKNSKLESSEISDLQNMDFKCIVQLTTNNGGVVEEEFRMKAYFEIDKWLVKEVRVGFGAKKLH